MGKTFFISDLHFGHKNILIYDNRPFKTVKEHDEAIIGNWNNTVGNDDDVYILGDISWYSPSDTENLFKKLNGRKHIIAGNHDKKLLKNNSLRQVFTDISDYKEIKVGDCGIVLCHYPIPCFNNHHHGWYHLYGHVHNSVEWNMMERVRQEFNEYDKPCRMINVGVMMPYMNYTPKTFEELVSDYGEWEKNKYE